MHNINEIHKNVSTGVLNEEAIWHEHERQEEELRLATGGSYNKLTPKS